MLLPANKKAKEVAIVVDPLVSRKLRPHQAAGVRFMWDACMGRRSELAGTNGCRGCILADDMGMGKTLQTCASIRAGLYCQTVC